MRPAAQLPEPGRFWIRYVPRAWPRTAQPAEAWTDLAAGRLAWGEARQAEEERTELDAGPEPLDDVLYLPPVPQEWAAERARLAGERLQEGTPVLLQLRPGEEVPLDLAGAVAIYDLLPALLRRDLAPLALLPPGAAAVWPLVPGFSDDPGFWEEAAALLASRQVACLQALPPQLDPADRRRLVELGGEGIFDAVFHGGGAGAVRDGVVPAERSFARIAGRWGLAPFLPRPLPRPPILRGENRRLAGVLALVAELWLRLGRPVGQGQGLYAMARQVDRTGYDLAALAREGNLGVLSWLDGTGREVALELATAGRSSLLASLLAEYAGGEGEET